MKPVLDWLRPWAERGQAGPMMAAYDEAFRNRPDLLADLARLCNADAETYVPGDPHATAFNEGRRAVWLHIQRMLSLTGADLRALQERMDHDRADTDPL